jgi:hypothetical protein
MLLYFNGDSFVAGVELADEILPEHPGYLSWPLNTERPEKIWLDNSHTKSHKLYRHNYVTFNKLSKIEYERAFPNKVAEITGLSVINQAKGGSSMDRIVRTTLSDLYALRISNPNVSLVAFVGTTHPNRSEIPSEFSVHDEIQGITQDWQCISTTYSLDNLGHHAVETLKLKVLYETNYHAAISFYRNVMLLNNFCKLYDIRLHWIAARDDVPNEYHIESRMLARPDLTMYQKCANLEYAIKMNEIVQTEFSGQPVICPGGHFAEPVHKKIAQEIVKILGKW